MRPLRIATFNVNSVRLRADLVARFVDEAGADVVCLQEIKCRDGEFPARAFADMGLRHLAINGQKGWHGVAIASRLPLEQIEAPAICPRGEARAVAARVDGIEIHNLYVPAGGDLPDPDANPKFAHKLAALARMREIYARRRGAEPLMVVGDLNVAPGEHDVWSHRQLLDVVSHTPVETAALEAARLAGDLVDVPRALAPEPQKLFTWWSYRSPDWTRNNRGRRLDHVWTSKDLAARVDRFAIHLACRAWPRPSDHVPLSVDLRV